MVSTSTHPTPEQLAAQLELDCLFTAKAHYNAEGTWTSRHYALGIVLTVVAAAVGTNLLKNVPYVPEVASAVVAVLGAVATFLKPSELALRHRSAGNQHLALRNEIRSSRMGGLTGTDAVILVQRFTSDRNKLFSDSPAIPRAAYLEAKKGIESGEANYKP
jgi:hypothetical protein